MAKRSAARVTSRDAARPGVWDGTGAPPAPAVAPEPDPSASEPEPAAPKE